MDLIFEGLGVHLRLKITMDKVSVQLQRQNNVELGKKLL